MNHKRNIETLKNIKGWIEIAMINEIDNDQLISAKIIYLLSQLHGELSRNGEVNDL